MKSKMFPLGIAALMLLFVFSGCQEPTDYSLTHNFHALYGPGDLQVNAYEGMNILQWSPVTDATGYRIVRKDLETNVSKILATNVTELWYRDAISWDNQMVADRDYEYAVISLSNYSTASSANATTIVQHGESRVHVIADMPPTSWRPALSANDVAVEKITAADGSDLLQVRITGKPNLEYTVSYLYGTGTMVNDLGFNRAMVGSPAGDMHWFYPTTVVTFPAIGGVNTVEVEARFAGGVSYYTLATKVSKDTPNVSVAGVFNAPGLWIQASMVVDGVDLEWSNISGAASYRIYRAQITAGSGSFIGVHTVISNWETVNTTQSLSGSSWSTRDTQVDTTKSYKYAIIAVDADGTLSAPAYTSSAAGPYTTTMGALVSSFLVTPHRYVTSPSPGYTTPNTPSPFVRRDVQIRWLSSETSVNYKLEYAEVSHPTNPAANATATSYQLLSEWRDIPVVAADFVHGEGVVTLSSTATGAKRVPDLGKNYLYRLTSQKGNRTETDYQILNNGGFTHLANFTLARDFSDNTSGRIPLIIRKEDSTWYGQSYQVQLFRRVGSPIGAETPFVPITSGSISIANGISGGYPTITTHEDVRDGVIIWSYSDSGPTGGFVDGRTYHYKLVVTTAGGTPVTFYYDGYNNLDELRLQTPNL